MGTVKKSVTKICDAGLISCVVYAKVKQCVGILLKSFLQVTVSLLEAANE